MGQRNHQDEELSTFAWGLKLIEGDWHKGKKPKNEDLDGWLAEVQRLGKCRAISIENRGLEVRN